MASRVTRNNSDYIVSVYQRGRKSAFRVTVDGAVTDMTSSVVLSSDISVVRTAFREAGMPEMMTKVQDWWDNH